MNKTIKNLTVAMVCGAAILGSPSVFASGTPHDLYMGFQNSAGGGTADYIINLGLDSNIVGGNTVVNLNGDFSFADFTSTTAGGKGLEGTNAADIVGGVVGAFSGSPAGTYVTKLRSGVGTPSAPGSSQPTQQTQSQDVEAWDAINNIATVASGTGALDPSLSWENNIEPSQAAGSFLEATGDNPDSPVTTNSVLYEDLWYTTANVGGHAAYVYQGYFTLTVGTSSATLTFTPKNASVPLTSPVIQSIQVTGNAATVVWSTVASHTYQLQYDLDLNTSNWVNVGTSQMATTGTLTNTDNSATQSLKFYRVTGQ